jgi:hypothetical protein
MDKYWSSDVVDLEIGIVAHINLRILPGRGRNTEKEIAVKHGIDAQAIMMI